VARDFLFVLHETFLLEANSPKFISKRISLSWVVAQWYSACPACARPWVLSQHQKRKEKKKKKFKV
jgi:hypothetical protein